jgi:hypothetical protein
MGLEPDTVAEGLSMTTENDGFLATLAKKKQGSRGKAAEAKIRRILVEFQAANPDDFQFMRPPDTRAAGRPMPPTVADFVCSHRGKLELALEVKETEHEYRLQKRAFPQYPRMRRHLKCGGRAYLAILHRTTKRWRLIDVAGMPSLEKGSWDLMEWRSFSDIRAELFKLL